MYNITIIVIDSFLYKFAQSLVPVVPLLSIVIRIYLDIKVCLNAFDIKTYNSDRME
jgi:hypothetical protein